MGWIITPPLTLPDPGGVERPLPAENSSNAWFVRAWAIYEHADGWTVRLDQVVNVPDNGQTRTINIKPGPLAFERGSSGGVDETTRLQWQYLHQMAALEAAEGVPVANLAPLDFSTEYGEYEDWLDDQQN